MNDALDEQRTMAALRERIHRLDDDALDLILRSARSYSAWLDKPVGDDILRRLYELLKMGPTSANCCPARIIFVRGATAKERLRPALTPGNVDQTMAAPVTAVIGYDVEFFTHLLQLFPDKDMRGPFLDNPARAETTAFRNGTLQGAYLIIAARALGLDTGPMSGFDNAKVDAAFFAGTTVKSNFLCNLGFGDPTNLSARKPRFDFDEVCQIV